MAFSRTINGTVYDQDNFNQYNYANEQTGLPALLGDMVEHIGKFGVGTSTTTLTPGTGEKSLTVSSTSTFTVGQWLVIAETANPDTNLMHGQVTAYNQSTGAMTFSVGYVVGSTEASAWSVALSGPQGIKGDTGDNGDIVGPATSTDDAFMLWNGTGGNTAKDSGFVNVPISRGGTGSTTASAARTALGLGSAAVLNAGTASSNLVQLDANANFPISTLGNVGLVKESRTASGSFSARAPLVVNGDSSVSVPGVDYETVSYIDADIFKSASTYNTVVSYEPVSNRYLIVYRDTTDSSLLKCVVAKNNAGNIEFGSEVSAGGDASTEIPCICSDGVGGVVLTYNKSTTGDIYAVAFTISNMTPTVGTPLLLEALNNPSPHDVVYGNGHFVAFYKNYTGSGYTTHVCPMTRSGTTLTKGTIASNLINGNTNYGQIVYDSEYAKFLAIYQDLVDNRTSYNVVTVSSNSASATSKAELFSNGTGYLTADYDAETNTYAILYSASGTSYPTAASATFNGTALAANTPVTVANDAVVSLSVVNSSSGIFTILYKKSPGYGLTAAGIKINGTSFDVGTKTTLISDDNVQTLAAAANGLETMAVFRNSDNSNYGEAVLSKVSSTADNWLYIADEAGTDGNPAQVIPRGAMVEGFSGLTPGAKYYVADDGSIDTTERTAARYFGRAASSTKMLTNGV